MTFANSKPTTQLLLVTFLSESAKFQPLSLERLPFLLSSRAERTSPSVETKTHKKKSFQGDNLYLLKWQKFTRNGLYLVWGTFPKRRRLSNHQLHLIAPREIFYDRRPFQKIWGLDWGHWFFRTVCGNCLCDNIHRLTLQNVMLQPS